MKLQIVSDLHIDVTSQNYELAKKIKCHGDILLMAGDICEYRYNKKEKFIKLMMSRGWKHIIEVPGNHDSYGKSAKWDLAEYSDIHVAGEKCTYHYLNNSFVDINNVRFICATLWSQIKNNIVPILRFVNDYNPECIEGYTIDLNNKRNLKSIKFIADTISSTPKNMKIVIMTHHLPLFELVCGEYVNSDVNEAYANNLTSLMTVYGDRISYWVHGHSHNCHEAQFYNVHFIRNPAGYFRSRRVIVDGYIGIEIYHENPEFDNKKIVEV